MWDPPGPGLQPVSPALAGGFLTTAPPQKSHCKVLFTYSFRLEKKSSRCLVLFKASSILQVLEFKTLKCIHLNTFLSALPTTLHYPFWYCLQMLLIPAWLLPTNKYLDTIFTLSAPITWLCLGNYNYSDPAFKTSSEHKASLYDWGWGGRLPGSTAKCGWWQHRQQRKKRSWGHSGGLQVWFNIVRGVLLVGVQPKGSTKPLHPSHEESKEQDLFWQMERSPPSPKGQGAEGSMKRGRKEGSSWNILLCAVLSTSGNEVSDSEAITPMNQWLVLVLPAPSRCSLKHVFRRQQKST